MTKLKNTQPLHNASVVPSIASEFWQKEPQGENSLNTSPDGGTIPALCKVGGAVTTENFKVNEKIRARVNIDTIDSNWKNIVIYKSY